MLQLSLRNIPVHGFQVFFVNLYVSFVVGTSLQFSIAELALVSIDSSSLIGVTVTLPHMVL